MRQFLIGFYVKYKLYKTQIDREIQICLHNLFNAIENAVKIKCT